MSNTPTQNEIDSLRRSVRRWKTLALALLAALGGVIGLGATTAAIQAQRARDEAAVARQAEMEARQQAEEARDQARRNLEKARQAEDAAKR